MLEHYSFKDSELSIKEWDEFVEGSDNGTIFHTRKFLSYHPKNRFKDASLVIKKKNNIFAVLPATIIEKEGKKILSSHQGASYGSFAYVPELNLQESFELIEILQKYAKEQKCNRIQLTLPPVIYQTKLNNYIDFALIKNGFTYLKRELSSVVQLGVPKEKLLFTYRAEARTALKKAQKMGVEIAECERFEEYYDILKKNLRMRHNVNPTHTLDELLFLKELFPTKIRLWGAFLDSKLIAGVCNFTANSRVVLAFYISHNDDYQEYRPVNLLFYEIMKRYSEEGFKYLDFGIFTVDMEPNWGLARFKENFGSRGIFRDYFYKDI